MDLNNNNAGMLRKVVYYIKRRARACVRNRGVHFEGKKWRL